MRRYRRQRLPWRRSAGAYERYYRPSPVVPRRRRSLRQRWGNLPEGTRRGVSGVLLLAGGMMLTLAAFGLAGPAGAAIDHALAQALGGMRFALPVAALYLGYLLARPDTAGRFPWRWLGAGLAVVGGAGLLHVPSSGMAWEAAAAGRGGGWLGAYLVMALVGRLGWWGTTLLALTAAVVGLLLFSHLSFQQVAAVAQWLAARWRELRQWQVQRKVKRLQRERPAAMPAQEPPAAPPVFQERSLPVAMDVEGTADGGEEAEALAAEPAPMKRPRRVGRPVDLPLALLNGQAGKPTSGDIKANQYLIEKTLKNFGIEAEMGEVNVGPTVTQYTLKPADGVKLSRIVGLSDNLALALAAHPIRIEAPIPGRSLIGIEVPNQSTAIVPLRVVLDSDAFRQRRSNLLVALGVDVKGQPWLADVGKMPHLMIAGATGSGKSVCINAIVLSLLFQNGPDDLKFIMVDPKRVELPIYNGIPHLITPVITDVKKTINALRWTIHEMERRFDVLAGGRQRDISAYNQAVPPDERLPYLVVVVDELADLMAAAGPEIEACIIRLAQMSRAVGIHLVIATQRPSVDVLTGLIKANITTRVAFSVASLVDSRTILDMSGAEKLLGRGDMLYLSAEIAKPKRLQGAYASDSEIKRVIEHLKNQAEPEYLEEVVERREGDEVGLQPPGEAGDERASDELLSAATDVIMRAGKASASLLQRRLRVGYARAARILDLLEQRGVVGPADGAKPREVLLRSGVEHGTVEPTGEGTARPQGEGQADDLPE